MALFGEVVKKKNLIVFLKGISFEDESKHIIAWKSSDVLKQVNVTLVSDQNTSVYVGTFGKCLIVKCKCSLK